MRARRSARSAGRDGHAPAHRRRPSRSSRASSRSPPKSSRNQRHDRARRDQGRAAHRDQPRRLRPQVRAGRCARCLAREPAAVVDAVLAGARTRRRSRRSKSTAQTQAACANGSRTQREITRLTRPFLMQHAERSQRRGARAVLQARPRGRAASHAARTCRSSTCCSAIRARGSAEAFVQALRPLAPRLYSIASSREAVGDEAHLTVAVVDYEVDGQRRLGAASAYLAEPARATRRGRACSSSRTSASACRPTRRAT